jgi:peptidoglycan/xylan/chitin deacetylase (PgdA/CDA1 family)
MKALRFSGIWVVVTCLLVSCSREPNVHMSTAPTITPAQPVATHTDPTESESHLQYGPVLPKDSSARHLLNTPENEEPEIPLQPAPDSIPILMYHSISNHPKNALCVAPDRFALEMKHLHDAGYHPIDFDALANGWLHKEPIPIKPILITFDDGYVDNYQAAYPVLKQYHFPATIFLITQFIGHPNMLTWQQIHEMDAEGLIKFGSHTLNHLDLSHMSESQQQAEILQSKQDLENELGHAIDTFCYPAGRYNDTTVKLVQKAGYIFAVTTHPGNATLSQGQWTLHRVRVSGDESVATFDSLFP